MLDPTLQRETVLAALEHLLAWPDIARSPQLVKFLDYIVQRKLDGEEHSIKAYSIAVDVFGRSVDFDPQSDPIVRVQARRLRGLIDAYYRGPGRYDPVRIGLPVGRYVPDFETIAAAAQPNAAVANDSVVENQAPAAARARRARAIGGVNLSWFALAVIMLGVATTGLALMTFGPMWSRSGRGPDGLERPSITVVEFQNLVGPADGTPKVAGLAIELVTDLDQFEDIDAHYGGGSDMNIAVGDGIISDYVLTGIVRMDHGVVQYSAILTDSASGDVVWNYTVPVAAADTGEAGVLDDVSRRLSLILGSPRGPLHIAARALVARQPALVGKGSVYLCHVLFDLYRETGSAEAAGRAASCVTGLPKADQASAIGLAMSGSLLAAGITDSTGKASAQVEQLDLAESRLDQAINLSPVSAFIWEQHARLRQQMGQFDKARTDYGSAIQLNPANGDALAGFARLLAFSGNAAAAETMARDAAEGTPKPPDWYFGVPALLALRSGDNAQAIEHAVRYARADPELGPILAIMAGQRGADSTIVNRYLAQVLDVASFRANGVLPRLRERIQDETLLEQIRGSLVSAGVPGHALDGPF